MLKIPATACLITREAEYPGDVWPPAGVEFNEVIIETRCPGLWRRYELALQARNAIIYTQDDDHIVDVPGLWARYGGRLTIAVKSHGGARTYERNGSAIVGRGAFFPKRLVDFKRWTKAYGTLMRRNVYDAGGRQTDRCEDDRIFTALAKPWDLVVAPTHYIRRPVRLADEPGALESRARCHELLRAL